MTRAPTQQSLCRIYGFESSGSTVPEPDCAIGEDEFDDVQFPRTINNQRVSGLRYGEERVQVLLAAIVIFHVLPKP